MTVNLTPVDPTSDRYEPTLDTSGDPTVDRTRSPADRESELRHRALEHLKKKSDFRVHLMIYALVNGMLVLIWAMTGAGFFWPAFPMAGWGIGVVANAYDVYMRTEPSEADITAEMDRLRGP
jgi:hypothetical protein